MKDEGTGSAQGAGLRNQKRSEMSHDRTAGGACRSLLRLSSFAEDVFECLVNFQPVHSQLFKQVVR